MQYQATQPLNVPRWDFRVSDRSPVQLGAVHVAAGGIEAQIPSKRGMTVHCISGAVWITQEGSLADIVLQSGEQFSTASRGKVVVQALIGSMVRFV